MSLLQARPRRRACQRRRGLRRHRGHQPEGARPSPRAAGAPRRHVPGRVRFRARRGEEDARVRRRYGEERGPRGLSGRGQRGAGGGPDRLSPALACAWRRETVRMSLIAQIEGELKAAMRARDQERTDTLRMTLSSLRAAEKDMQRPLKEDEELQVLQRERKRRREAADAFREGDRPEQADKEDRELAVIEEFMPEPMSEDAIEQIIDDAIAETGATSLRDLGRVMADVMPQVAGRADGSTVSQLVREKLA